MRLKKNDEVIVIAGSEKGKRGTIVSVSPKEQRVVVSGVNLVRKRKRAAEGSSYTEVEFPVHVSNVAFYDVTAQKASRVKYNFDNDGKKVRVLSASNSVVAS